MSLLLLENYAKASNGAGDLQDNADTLPDLLLSPLLGTRPIIRTKSQSGHVLGLPMEEKGYSPERQGLTNRYQQEAGKCAWKWILNVLDARVMEG